MENSYNCSNCAYASISDTKRFVYFGGTTVLSQNGGNNIVCLHTGDKSLSFYGDLMVCSAFKHKNSQHHNCKTTIKL